MNIGFKILFIVGLIILIIIIILVLLFIVPFRYLIKLLYVDNELSFDFKYSVVTFNAFISFKSKLKYYLKILGITIFDSDSAKETDNKKKTKKDKAIVKNTTVTQSLNDTDFLKDKSINEDLRASREDARELLKTAKRFEKEELKELIKSGGNVEKIDFKTKIDSFIDGLQNIIPPEMKYVLKKVSDEVFKLLKKLAPSDVDIDISYGSSDPYMLGLSYAVLAPVISLTGGDVNVKPKFGRDEISAKVELARRVPLITIVIPVVRLLLDKKFRNIVFSKNKGSRSSPVHP